MGCNFPITYARDGQSARLGKAGVEAGAEARAEARAEAGRRQGNVRRDAIGLSLALGALA